jgi:hypothetical protein
MLRRVLFWRLRSYHYAYVDPRERLGQQTIPIPLSPSSSHPSPLAVAAFFFPSYVGHAWGSGVNRRYAVDFRFRLGEMQYRGTGLVQEGG